MTPIQHSHNLNIEISKCHQIIRPLATHDKNNCDNFDVPNAKIFTYKNVTPLIFFICLPHHISKQNMKV